jgi:hypothetical protein
MSGEGRRPDSPAAGPEGAASDDKRVEQYPPPEPEPPEPSFKQYLIGWGLVFLALVAAGVLLGVLMRVLR